MADPWAHGYCGGHVCVVFCGVILCLHVCMADPWDHGYCGGHACALLCGSMTVYGSPMGSRVLWRPCVCLIVRKYDCVWLTYGLTGTVVAMCVLCCVVG